MDERLIPLVVALIGVFNVGLAIYFGRRANEADANKDDALATQAITNTYAKLVERLEIRVEKLEERCLGYEAIIAELELKCMQYELQLDNLELD